MLAVVELFLKKGERQSLNCCPCERQSASQPRFPGKVGEVAWAPSCLQGGKKSGLAG